MEIETFATICGLALLILFIGNILYFALSLIREEIRDYRDRIIFSGPFNTSLKNEFEKYFVGRFDYYDKLPEHLRVKFLIRVKKFIRSKTFKGRNDLIVTEEMKALVAAAAVQLTFGLESFVLDHFSLIFIYPESYYSPVTGRRHMGEANPSGIIVISWKDFLRGYALPHDTYNVGLHEMSHALELEKQLGGRYDFYFTSYYEKWKSIAEDEYQNVRENGGSFFRNYAGTNRHEFFAVSVEHFFEASEEFSRQLPQIYNHLCILLNQDPLSNDTRIKEIQHIKFDAMMLEIVTLPKVHVTNYTLGGIFLFPAILVFINLFFSLKTKSINYYFLGMSFLLIVIDSIPRIMHMNKIVLYDKYLSINNVFGKLIGIFPLDEIVSISFSPAGNQNSIQILIARSGKMFKNKYLINSTPDDKSELKRLLSERNVICH